MSRCEEVQDDCGGLQDDCGGLFTAEIHALSEGGMLSCLLVSNIAYLSDNLVLPALRRLRTNGPPVIDVLQLLDKAVGQHNAGISFLEVCKDRIFARLAVDCMTNTETCELIRTLKEYQTELLFALPKKTLLDEMPTLYRSLVHELEGVSEQLLVESAIFSKLKSLAALMDIAISEFVVAGANNRGSNLSVSTYHRMLLPILWDLGRGSPAATVGTELNGSAVSLRSSDASAQQHLQQKAVRVLSFQAKESCWQLLSKRHRHIVDELNNAVADKLQVR